MVSMRGPTIAEEIILGVVEQMLREKRKPAILALIQRTGMRAVTDEEITNAIHRLVAATEEDEGVTFTPWEAIAIRAYLQRLELTIKGELYR